MTLRRSITGLTADALRGIDQLRAKTNVLGSAGFSSPMQSAGP